MAKTTYTCDQCGSGFLRFPSQVRGANKFCSFTCKGKFLQANSTGVNNPNYRSGAHCEPSLCECGRRKDHRAKICAGCAGRSFPIGGAGPVVPDEEILASIPKAKTLIEVASTLGVNRFRVQQLVRQHNVNLDHMHRAARRPYTAETLLRKGTAPRGNGQVRSFVIKNELLPYECIECGLGPKWNDKPLTLELDHINGDPCDNRLENLRFLCPNCHTQTPTSKGRNIGRGRKEVS